MSAIPRYFFVFDVESIGLHGEGFQVGWVVLDMQDGGRLDEGLVQCLPRIARANAASTGSLSMGDRSWVDTHVKTAVAADAAGWHRTRWADNTRDVRQVFWGALEHAKATYTPLMVAADVPAPVEANFLRACIEDDYANRRWAFPYPLVDVASVLLAKGLDPTATYPRHANEEPQHNALADARQSARILFQVLTTGVIS